MGMQKAKMRRTGFMALGIALLVFASSGIARADYPTKPITLIIPWSAGGPADLIWRALAEPMGKILGSPLSSRTSPVGPES